MYKERTSFCEFAVGFIRGPYPICTLLLFLFIAASSCNSRFDVYTNNGKYYSIFGFLNAKADTQYIRVEELRDSLPMSTPAHLNVVVKLTDLTSNRSVILHDSLVRFAQGPVHNYYTTEKIIPLHTYRLTVDGPDEAQSSAQISMPDTFPKPLVDAPIPYPFTLHCDPGSKEIYKSIRIRGISRLVAVNVIYHTTRKQWTINHLADTTRQSSGLITVKIHYDADLCQAYPIGSLQRIDIVIAAGNSDWPNLVGLDTETEALPTVATNIKGGIGFLGGIVTDTLKIY